jgi:serine/threonine-protein kinase 24/25/MST4
MINRNASVRQHIQTTRSLFPHKRVVRRSEFTSKGLIVTEEEEISGLPSSAPAVSASAISSSSNNSNNSSGSGGGGGGKRRSATPVSPEPDAAPVRRSPIAELLYVRWLEGLKLKWPSLGGS